MMGKNSTSKRKMMVLRRRRHTLAYHLTGRGRLFFGFLLAMTSFVHAAGEQNDTYDQNAVNGSGQMQTTNTFCPVMPDMKINPEIFTEYKDKKIYFCCVNCRAAFIRNPEKYIGILPQFGGTSAQADIDYPSPEQKFAPGRLIEPMGITTLSLLVLTGLTGLFRRKLPRSLLKWHKRFGIITLVSASIHVILVLIAH